MLLLISDLNIKILNYIRRINGLFFEKGYTFRFLRNTEEDLEAIEEISRVAFGEKGTAYEAEDYGPFLDSDSSIGFIAEFEHAPVAFIIGERFGKIFNEHNPGARFSRPSYGEYAGINSTGIGSRLAQVNREYADALHILFVAVVKEHQDHGVSSALKELMVFTGQMAGYKVLTLHCRKELLPFYTEEGFELIIKKPKFYLKGEDAYLMIYRK